MTTLVICNCGRVQEYDDALDLTCPHCDSIILSPDMEGDEDEY
tara:strand:+ start:118 stop:246 length:129 start_codon:yes stop_codon:yes gene_type:complete